ncbi:MAG: hypothetical protein Q9227_004201 [Pyrenula ochraceoflavens]
MIVNGLYTDNSTNQHQVRRDENLELNAIKFTERDSQGVFPAGVFPAGVFPAGVFPANHPFWRHVPQERLDELSNISSAPVPNAPAHEDLLKVALDNITVSVRSAQLTATCPNEVRLSPMMWLCLLDLAQLLGRHLKNVVRVLDMLIDAQQKERQDGTPLEISTPTSPPIVGSLLNWVKGTCLWVGFCRPILPVQPLGFNPDKNPLVSATIYNPLAALKFWALTRYVKTMHHWSRAYDEARKRNRFEIPRDEAQLFTNIRIEFLRGDLPPDIKPYDLNRLITNDVLSILEDGWHPPNGWNVQYDNGHPQKRNESHTGHTGLVQRDDLEDLSCIPGSDRDLKILIYNLWLTQFRPAVKAEPSKSGSMAFGVLHDEFGGPNQIHKGGPFVVKMWTSKTPDFARLKDTNTQNYDSYDFPGEDRSIPSIDDPHNVAQGVECFTDARPENSVNVGGWPRRDWIYSVTDACYQSWGKAGTSPDQTTGFTYQGKGKNWETDKSTDGLGWGFRYKPLGCRAQLKCQDFTGLHFDAVDNGHKEGGDLNNLFTTCSQRKVNPDGLFRGGRLYHVHGSSGSDELRKSSKRDTWDPNHPSDPAIPDRCGVIEVWPLLQDIEITTNPGGTDKIIEGPTLGQK